ncbi:MAG: histidine kinase dimerization/phospho-acceptor domain-containing protein, partial [Akkermansiaceae bacterium]
MLEVILVLVLLGLLALMVWQNNQHKQSLLKLKNRSREVRREALQERDALLDALGDAFLLVNQTSQIVFANACAKDLVKGRKLIGRSIMEAFLDDRLSVAIMKCVRTGKPMQERVILHSAHTPLGAAGEEGGSVWVIDASPMEGSMAGNETMTRVVIRDVTVEHQADQVRRDFVANASHELRTPMAIINGYLENLLDDDVLEEPEMSRKFLETMRKHGNRISRLVEDMLVISKMESGDALMLNEAEFSLKACVQDVCERLES